VTIAYRRGASNPGSGTTLTCSLPSCNLGDLIVVSVAFLDTPGTTTCAIPTDTAGNTYHAAAPKARQASSGDAIYTFYAYGVKSSSTNTVTAVLSASTAGAVTFVEEWKSSNGAWVSDPFDKTSAATGNVAAASSGSVTPTTDGQLIYAVIDAVGMVSASGGFTQRISAGGGTDATLDLIQTSKAPIAATATVTPSYGWVIQVSTFADVAGAPAPPAVPGTSIPGAPTVPTVASSPSAGKAPRMLVGGDEITDEDLLPNPRQTETTAPTVINDYWWPSGLAATPSQIPLCWFARPLGMRLERPFNHAEVSQVGGASARADNLSSIAFAKGVYPFSASLNTAVDADPANLAHWTVTYYGDPRMRSPNLRMDLLYRTDDQKRFLLRLGIGTRIQIIDIPPEWPSGAQHLVIVGIGHELTLSRRILRWTTQPVVGTTPGAAGPWFRWGASVWSGADTRPF